MLKFNEFINKKERDTAKQLRLIEELLKKNGIKAVSYIKEDNPYVYVFNSKNDTFFEGIRIYKIGDQLAFRVQKEEKTHPFGTAYSLPIEEMFQDLLNDYKPEVAGKKVISAIISEIKRFFDKSAEAEREIRDKSFDNTGIYGKVVIRSQDFGTDYSNLTYMGA